MSHALSRPFRISKTSLSIIGLGLLNILIHIIFYNKLEYHRDELLYFSLGLHPDFGYASVPPLIGWLAAGLQTLFGYSLFAVKIFPALLSGVFVVVGCAIAKELGGKTYARILTGIAIIIMPSTLRTFHLFQPVHLDVFFWTLLFYYTLRYINSQKDTYLIYIGIVFGLAMMNKYLVALLLPALLFSVLFTQYRNLFGKRAFYAGLSLGFLIFLPNLIWQIAHGLPVIHHMQELSESQLVHVSRSDFLKEQLLMPFASSLLVIPGMFFLWKEQKYRFLLFSVLLVVLTLLIFRGKSYYTLGIFPLLTASGATLTEKYLKNSLVRFILPAFLVILSLPIVPMGIPVWKEEGMVAYFRKLELRYGLTIGRRFEDGSIHSLPQDYADQIGWEELTRLTSLAYQQIPDTTKALIYCENYGQAAAISIIGKKYYLPEPVSFSDHFFYLKPASFHPDREYFIYINDELGADVDSLFQKIRIIGSISNVNAREFGTTVYLCEQPVIPFNEFWKEVLRRFGE